jgi:hypothetical protein
LAPPTPNSNLKNNSTFYHFNQETGIEEMGRGGEGKRGRQGDKGTQESRGSRGSRGRNRSAGLGDRETWGK